jgi:plastocyanin
MTTSTKPPNPYMTPPPEQLLRVNGSIPAGSSDNAWHGWMMVGVGLTGLLATVAIIASVLALAAKGATHTTVIRQVPVSATHATSSSSATSSATGGMATAASLGSGTAQSAAGAVVPIVLQKDATTGIAGTITAQPGWPRFAPSTITVPAGKKVTIVITNYDDVNTPLPAGLPYNKVQGGQETVNGKPVTFVSNKTIAHTFTVTGLGVNIPVPMASAGGPATITFTFTAHKAGTYTWQCYTPCGSGKSGTGGPMMKPGYMQGTITVA